MAARPEDGRVSLRLEAAAVRAYDALKRRPGAPTRTSDARDAAALNAVTQRLRELVADYRVGGHEGPAGATYVFWTEVSARIEGGLFDDLLDRL
jgi:hypothetical protein